MSAVPKLRLRERMRYEFGPFTADAEVGTLMRRGEVVPLPPKVFDVLLALLKSGQAPIGREELMKAVWGDVFVEEGNLTNAISVLRKALCSNGDESDYIVTIPRRGYRFAIPIREHHGKDPGLKERGAERFIIEPLTGQNGNGQAAAMAAALEVRGKRLFPSSAAGNRALRRTAIRAFALLLLLAASSALIIWRLYRSTGPAVLQYTPLTNFTDSAVGPALSPDGRILAFIRSEYTFGGPGQIYVKLLPDGQPVQLTHDELVKRGSPKFSPDGTLIAYAASKPGSGFDTWVVPVLGGEPSLLVTNASGLSWIEKGDRHSQLLFSELTGRGEQMAIVSSTTSRLNKHLVYMPPETGMAHRSYPSPDGKQVLIVEMDRGIWLPCRLTPFDGSSAGKPVGPAAAQCTDAAWSPDGKWMYFSADTGNGFHIWRQRFPDGIPQQITAGAPQEEGIELARDGRFFVTSIGSSQSTLWFHDSRGDRQITSEGYGFLPSIAPDGKKLYYLLRAGTARHYMAGELWAVDLGSGQRQRLLADFLMLHYSISADGRRVVFVASDDAGRSPVWVAALDGRSAPQQVTAMDASRVYFAAGDYVLFASQEGKTAYRVREDGSELKKILQIDSPAALFSGSPDGRWLAIPGSPNKMTWPAMVYPVSGGAARLLCGVCASGNGVERVVPPAVSWSVGGKFLYLKFRESVYAIPLRRGEMLPPIPTTGFRSEDDVAALPGTRLIPREGAFPGPNPSIYAFTKVNTLRNIYRVSVP